jgi:outer membrane protein assembly factor BamB
VVWVDAILLQIRRETTVDRELFVFASDWEGRLYRFEAGTGEITHSLDIGRGYGDACPGFTPLTPSILSVGGRPLLTEESIYAPTSDEGLAALSLDSLDILWSIPVGPIRVGPTLDQNALYLVTEDGVLWAIDKEGGTQIWTREVASGSTALAAADGIVVITVDSGLVAYKAP